MGAVQPLTVAIRAPSAQPPPPCKTSCTRLPQPGCNEPAQQAVHQSWLREMGAFLRRVDPLHLIGAATEGFFVKNETNNLNLYNPGARGALA
jgi:hypothetical protein